MGESTKHFFNENLMTVTFITVPGCLDVENPI